VLRLIRSRVASIDDGQQYTKDLQVMPSVNTVYKAATGTSDIGVIAKAPGLSKPNSTQN
jgi:hypothetical protein